MVIYKIENLVNGKVYIGQALDFNKRKGTHKRDSKKLNYPLYCSMRKYGIENFSFEILYHCDNKLELNYLERYMIGYYNSTNRNIGYNIHEGGNVSPSKSPEARKKISESVMGHVGYFKGRKHTEEAKKKCSDGNKGKVRTQEMKDAHSEKMKGKTHIHNKERAVKIKCSNGEIYDSIWEAASKLNLNRCNISTSVNGKRGTVGGLKFEKIQ